MKKIMKVLSIIVLILIVILCGFFFYYKIITRNYHVDKRKLINTTFLYEIYDENENKITTTNTQTEIAVKNDLNDFTKKAFIAVEDRRFYNHNGIDCKALLRATVKNVKSGGFKEGGSTITQQLIKNTHLSSEKTIKRKLIEIKLAKELEKNYSKDEILEKYLNTIYFGDNVYGIENASNYYFDKSASMLNLNESAVLAGMLKAPNIYSPLISIENATKRRNIVLKCLKDEGYISNDEYNKTINEPIIVNNNIKHYGYTELCQIELSSILTDNPYGFKNCKIYTYCDSELQNKIDEILNNINEKYDTSIVLLDKNNEILSYSSTCKIVKRQLGSTIKPIAVYAPAIEEEICHPITKIVDEKTDFDGYTPSNYKNKYYGEVTIKTALEKSLNVPAVKLINDLGLDKSVNYLNNCGLKVSKSNGLSIALGGTKEEFTLTDITSAYSIFNNGGKYVKPKTIKKIVDSNGKTIYENKLQSKKVISEDTAYLTADMLKGVVENGTAKRLINKNATIYAKTGTNGNKKGNFDAYNVSFTNKYTLGVWCGNYDYSPMPNEITGGNLASNYANSFYEEVYTKKCDTSIKKPNTIKEVYLDKSEYENNNKFVISDDIAPHQEKICAIFSTKSLPKEKSTKYSAPQVKINSFKYSDERVKIEFSLNKYINLIIFRKRKNENEIIYDSNDDASNNVVIDDNLKNNTEYIYSVLPYYKYNGKIIYGDEIFLGKIKTEPIDIVPKDWWDFINETIN